MEFNRMRSDFSFTAMRLRETEIASFRRAMSETFSKIQFSPVGEGNILHRAAGKCFPFS